AQPGARFIADVLLRKAEPKRLCNSAVEKLRPMFWEKKLTIPVRRLSRVGIVHLPKVERTQDPGKELWVHSRVDSECRMPQTGGNCSVIRVSRSLTCLQAFHSARVSATVKRVSRFMGLLVGA